MKKCPRCGLKTMHDKEARNALSRYDNKTSICSSCGMDEAMLQFAGQELSSPNQYQ